MADRTRLLPIARELLTDAADVAGYGFAIRTPAPALGIDALVGPGKWPPLHDPDVDPRLGLRWFRLLEDTHIPEAFVIQLLSRHNLSAVDLTPWDVTPRRRRRRPAHPP